MAVKPSVAELARNAKNAMVVGSGGGGDVILTISVANYLELLGVENIYVGGVSSQWWNPEGGSRIDNFVIGPKVYDVTKMENAEMLAPMVAKVNPKSTYDIYTPAEAAVSAVVPWPVIIGGLTDGVVGLRDSLNQLIAEHNIDLFISADIGAHSFHDGKETTPPFTTLVALMTLSAMLQLDCPVVYSFSGYTCDAEMEIEELDERVGRIMKAGGYLGAYGLSQKDVEDSLKASEAFPDPIIPLVAKAAQGDLGLKKVPVISPWGRRAYITPLSSIYLFLDPQIMVNEVSKGVELLKETRSMAEAEKIYQEDIGLFPETRVQRVVNYVREEDD
ncbi:MAG: DUF1152 domain-containing protein [Chloroflexi bacterium]|nr:MAG: DUF1152 domain-containing protein [Chloroflexota bacterium]MBL1196439.1 DUF1152 domain-containing protein [Chloroflexota bacterium]NOH13734.1 DUF1152 domain-containing protein [Chloroflexota bacterium]